MWIEKKDEDQTAENAQSQTSIGSGGTTPQIQTSQTPAVGTVSSMAPSAPKSPQKFGTIQDYFKANKPQSEKLGEQFVSSLDQVKQEQQQKIGQAADVAKGQVASNVVGYDQDLISKAVTDPTQVAGSDDDYSKFMRQWDAAYKGPQSFESTEAYNQAAQAAQAAKSKAEQAGTTGGRQQLLQEQFGVLGAGNKNLDEALLQQSSQFGQVGEKAKELGSLQDYLGAKSQEVGTEAQKAKETTEQTKQKTREALSSQQPELEKSLKDRLSAAEALRNQYNQQAAATRDWATQINPVFSGYDPANKQTLQEYLKTPSITEAPTLSSVTTPEEAQRLAALEKLTGSPSPVRPGDQALGTYTEPTEQRFTELQPKIEEFQKAGHSPQTAQKMAVADKLATDTITKTIENLQKTSPYMFGQDYLGVKGNPNLNVFKDIPVKDGKMDPKAVFNRLGGMVIGASNLPAYMDAPHIQTYKDIEYLMQNLVRTVPELFSLETSMQKTPYGDMPVKGYKWK